MGRGRVAIWAAATALAVAGLSFAQSRSRDRAASAPPPATAPAAGPRVAADESTPRGTLKVLLGAMQDADEQKLKSILMSHSPLEERMVDAIVKRADAEKRFRGAVEKAYGAGGLRTMGNDSEAMNAASIAQIDSADERVDGDLAYVSAGQGSEMRLQKLNGTWKVPVAQMASAPAERDAAAAAAADQQAPPGATQPGNSNLPTTAPTAPAADGTAGKEKAIEEKLDDEKLAVQIMNDISSEIDQGKYKTPQEARDAIQMKMMVEMMKRYGANQPQPAVPGGATTQPTTEPSRTS